MRKTIENNENRRHFKIANQLIITAIYLYPFSPKLHPYSTPCCGRVTTEFFRLEIISVWQNSQIAD